MKDLVDVVSNILIALGYDSDNDEEHYKAFNIIDSAFRASDAEWRQLTKEAHANGYREGVQAALDIAETKAAMWSVVRSLKMTYYGNAAKEIAKLIKGLIK